MHGLPQMEGGLYSEPISLIGMVAKHPGLTVAFACRDEGSWPELC